MGEAFVAVRPEATGFGQETEGILRSTLGAIPGPALFAGLAVAGAGAALAIGEHFEDAYHTIEQRTGAVGTALQGLEGTFRDVISSTPGATFDATANALSVLADRTGLTGTALEDYTRKEIELGKITKTDVGQNVTDTTALFGQFGVAVDQQAAKLDVLFKATQVSGSSLSDIESTMKSVTPVAQLLGLTFDQTAALTANLTRLGLPATKVMMGLGAEFAKAAKAGKDPISVIQDMVTAIKSAPDSTAAATVAISDFGIGARQAAVLVEGLRSGALTLGDTVAQLTSGDGGIEATTAATLSLGDKFDLLKNKALVALEPIGMKAVDLAGILIDAIPTAVGYVGDAFSLLGDLVSPIIDKLGGAWSDFVSGFTQGTDNIGSSQTTWARWGAVAYEAFDNLRTQVREFADFWLPRLQDMWTSIVGLWDRDVYPVLHDKILPVLQEVAGWIGDHLNVVLAGTAIAIGLFVAPFTTVAVGLLVLYERSETFRGAVDALGRDLLVVSDYLSNHWKEALTIAGASVFGLIAPLVYAYFQFDQFRVRVDQALNTVGPALADFVRFFEDRWSKISLALENVGKAFLVLGAVIVGPVLLVWRYFHDQILAVVQLVWGNVEVILSTFVRVIGDVFDVVISLLSGDWGGAWDAFKDIPAAAIDFFVGMLGNLLDFVVNFFSSLPGNIADAVSALEGAIEIVGTKIVDGVVAGLAFATGGIVGWVKALPGNFISWIGDSSTWLVQKGVDVVSGMLGGLGMAASGLMDWLGGLIWKVLVWIGDSSLWLVSKGIDLLGGLISGLFQKAVELGKWFADLPGKVLGFVGDLGGVLIDAGKRLIQGLIDGVGSMFGSVKDKLGDLTNSLTSWKGPPEKDRLLLHGTGQMIIQGFINGLESKYGDVRDSLGALTAGLAPGVKFGIDSAGLPTASAPNRGTAGTSVADSAGAPWSLATTNQLLRELADAVRENPTAIIKQETPIAAPSTVTVLRNQQARALR